MKRDPLFFRLFNERCYNLLKRSWGRRCHRRTNREPRAWQMCPFRVAPRERRKRMNRDLIEHYQAGSDKLRRAVAGLSREQLQARPGPGAWSIQEVIVHLADSDAISIDRMKRIVAEDNPSLLYADETAYNDKLHPHEQDLA